MFEDAPSYETFQSRFWAMSVLFVVSLFASSFPALSRRIRYLRIPRVVFFLGKHFGTGVILATAFVHLLQDAFDNLSHPDVKARWSIGKWTGLIVFGSLLSIFLIEYISTSFVDRLQSYSSPSPSPPRSRPSSRAPSFTQIPPPRQSTLPIETERTHLLPSNHSHHSYVRDEPSLSPTTAHVESHVPPMVTVAGTDVIFSGGHHRHEERASHTVHSCPGNRKSIISFSEADVDEADAKLTGSSKGSERGSRLSRHQHHEHGGHSHGHVHVDMEGWDPDASSSTLDDNSAEEPGKVRVGHKRQVVGILMLQVGIMIHSLVIGLTLSIASGAEFTSLITAIIFHQLFEGLSLGIRIASLPSSSSAQPKRISFLKSILMFTFAITPPIGIALGLALFGGGRSAGAQLRLTSGVLSAISSGMLIYAACVEMLAGDFVMDPSLWKRSVGDQAMAVGSLLAGAAGMSFIGWVKYVHSW